MNNLIPGFEKEDVSYKDIINAKNALNNNYYVLDDNSIIMKYDYKKNKIKDQKIVMAYSPSRYDKEDAKMMANMSIDKKMKIYNEKKDKNDIRFNSLLNMYTYIVSNMDFYLKDNKDNMDYLIKTIAHMRTDIDQRLRAESKTESYNLKTVFDYLLETTIKGNKASCDASKNVLKYYEQLGAIVYYYLEELDKYYEVKENDNNKRR